MSDHCIECLKCQTSCWKCYIYFGQKLDIVLILQEEKGRTRGITTVPSVTQFVGDKLEPQTTLLTAPSPGRLCRPAHRREEAPARAWPQAATRQLGPVTKLPSLV